MVISSKKSLEETVGDHAIPATGKVKDFLKKEGENTANKLIDEKKKVAYDAVRPSGLSKLIGLGLMAGTAYLVGPAMASLGIASKIGSFLSVASKYVGYGMAAIMPGSIAYSIPTLLSRNAKAIKYAKEYQEIKHWFLKFLTNRSHAIL